MNYSNFHVTIFSSVTAISDQRTPKFQNVIFLFIAHSFARSLDRCSLLTYSKYFASHTKMNFYIKLNIEIAFTINSMQKKNVIFYKFLYTMRTTPRFTFYDHFILLFTLQFGVQFSSNQFISSIF